MIGYDNLAINHQILLDLPFREATGAITHDMAKPHHPFTLVNAPTWTTLPSGLMVLDFSGVDEYLESAALDTIDLNFTDGDYSIGAWINWIDTGFSEIVIGRYRLDTDGWEIYLYEPNNSLNQRHHHSLTIPNENPRSACYSVGWFPGTWYLMGISRSGNTGIHYRNGVALDMIYDPVSGLIDPESNDDDLVVGIRFTKDINEYKGKMWRPRVWNRALGAEEWAQIFDYEKHWFGV